MYKCEWCGHADVEPNEFFEEDTGYRGLTCSRCGSDVWEAEECIECEEFFSKECGDDFFSLAQGKGLCLTCLNTLCNCENGLEYLKHYNLIDDFIKFLIDDNSFPFVERIVENFLESGKTEVESLSKQIWDYVQSGDVGHFAYYIYEKRG